MQTNRIQNAVKALLLIGLGLFFYSRLVNGTLFFYINKRFVSFTLLAVFGLILVGLSYRYERREPVDQHEHSHADPGNDEHHGHDHDHRLSWGSALLIMLPIVLGIFVSPQPLGASALTNREINRGLNTINTPGIARATAEKSSTEKNVMDWWQTFRTSPNPNTDLAGQAVDVIGFVYHEQHFGQDHFMVARFVVSCCVADASALGLAVQWPTSATLKDDQWVEVKGRLAAGHLDNWQLPVLVAQSVTSVDVPNQPYLYP
jgi:putative membrane protein